MTPSASCYDLIRHSERLRLKAYLCPAGVWTLGYGHTGGVRPGDTCTPEEAENMLRVDADREAAPIRELLRNGVPLTQNQFDALVSFAFNIGATNFDRSTLKRKLLAGDIEGAAAEFPRWVRADGKVLPGLVVRRDAERALFERP